MFKNLFFVMNTVYIDIEKFTDVKPNDSLQNSQ